MGNIISYHIYKCCKCNITINYQNDLEPYYLIGKGKYNNKYICFKCIKSIIDETSLVKHEKVKKL